MNNIDIIHKYKNALFHKRFTSVNSRGRRYEDEEDVLGLDPYFLDAERILESKAFRRLAGKAQVFCAPENPHVRTRMSHTVEVFSIATYISRVLGLNDDLCRAIALGHDVGHPPYGHIGERVLSELGEHPFRHNVNSVVILQHVERSGGGLNLTYETLNGILNHSRGKGKLFRDESLPEEFAVVMYSDKIAYAFSDLNDAIRVGILSENNIPAYVHELGPNQRERVKTCVAALIEESAQKGFVSFSEGEIFEMFEAFRQFMHRNVYEKICEDLQITTIKKVYDFLYDDPHFKGVDPVLLLSLFTDAEINKLGDILYEGRPLRYEDFYGMSILEIMPYLVEKEIRYWDPDLDW